MNDDTQESAPRRRYFRYAVLTLAALLVLSLGFVLIPREPGAPAPPPFSEQARAAAYADAVLLGAAVRGLQGTSGDGVPAAPTGAAADAGSAAMDRTVTLLTVQARALMLPGKSPGSGGGAMSAGAPAAAPPGAPPATTADFAAALQASGTRRISDAETADGGMARLLAGVGVAQVLAAGQLAAAAGLPPGTLPGDPLPPAAVPSAVPASPELIPSAGCTATPAGPGGAPPGGPADLASALAAVLDAERELVYAYQAALPRIGPGSGAPASDFVSQHENLSHQAREAAGAHCAGLPPTPAGYAVDSAFLADPAAALGTLEASTLPAYADVIALSTGSWRAWAVAALQSAARRTAYWGASPGPVAGVDLDESALPVLPAAEPAPSAGGPPSRGTP